MDYINRNGSCQLVCNIETESVVREEEHCFPFSLFLVHKLKIVSGKFQSRENILGSTEL